MLQLPAKAALVGLLLGIVLFSGGCKGKRTVTVTGSVVREGKPIPVSATGYLQVTLVPDAGPDVQFTPKIAECDKATGAFQILEVPPGKYKIGVEQYDPTPQADKLKGAFRANDGKILREIDGKSPLTIDLAKP